MSRSHRSHLAPDEFDARKHTRRRLKTDNERNGKTAKADRKGQRSKLREARKEYVR